MRYFRKLTVFDGAALRDHYLRLDADDRRLRFFGPVSDAFVERYALRMLTPRRRAIGCFDERGLCAVGELVLGGPLIQRRGEIALSVERRCRRQGIGAHLLGLLITMARNRAVQDIRVSCLRENYQMRRLVEKHQGRGIAASNVINARIDPAWPDLWSCRDEAVSDFKGARANIVRALFT